MKIKLLASSVLMASTLLASGSASATLEWFWQGTLTDWSNANYDGNGLGVIRDIAPIAPNTGTVGQVGGDGDTTFTFISSSIIDPSATNVTLKEEEYNGGAVDLYNVGFGWGASQSSGSISYSISTTEFFDLVGLDSVVSLSGNVSKYLYSSLTDLVADTNPFLTLHSVNGSHDPIVGLTSFSDMQTIYVKDVINSGNINDIHNEFSVPEPLTITLMGIGLAAFGVRRRFV